MGFQKEKEEIRDSLSYTIILISKLSKDDRILERDKMYLRSIRTEIKTISNKLKDKRMPIYNKFRISRLNKNLSTNNLILFKSK